MAEAAQDQLFWITLQFYATLASVGGLIATLIFTAKATLAAERAVEASEQSVEQARDTASRQLRAYVCVIGTKVKWTSGQRIEIEIKIKNTGQTPAYRIRHATVVCVGQPPDFDLPPESGDGANLGDLGSGVWTEWPAEIGPLPNPQYEAIRARSIPLFVWGEVRYDDIFRKDPRYTRYRMVLNKNLEELSPVNQGNESN